MPGNAWSDSGLTGAAGSSLAPPVARAGVRLQILAYAALIVPLTMMQAPLVSSLPALYAKYTTVGLTQIGIALMMLRLFDGLIDPAIGYLSDRTRSRFGHRKPWIAAGVLLGMAAVWLCFHIPPHGSITWFVVTTGAVYLAWTLIEIPHAAWLSEIASDYDARARLAGWRTTAGLIGRLSFSALPMLPVFATAAMTPAVLALGAGIIVSTLPLAGLAALFLVPSGQFRARNPANLRDVLNTMRTSGPLRLICLTTTLSWLSSGMVGALYFFYLDVRLGILGYFSYIGTAAAVTALASSLLWPRIIMRIGNHRALAISKAVTAITLVNMALIAPGSFAFPALLGVFVVSALVSPGGSIALTAMIADAADYDSWKTGTVKTGTFYAASVICQKLGTAIGGGAAFVIVGLFGFHATGANSSVAMSGFFIAFIAVPFALNALAAVVAFKFPITRSAQKAISRRLARRAKSMPAPIPSKGASRLNERPFPV